VTLVQVEVQYSPGYKLAGDEISQVTKMLYYQMILSRCRMSVGISVLGEQNFDVIKNLSRYGVRPILARSICTNGPAIKGVCVTRRQAPSRSWYFSQKAVTVQGGYGVVFAMRVQSFISITCVAPAPLLQIKSGGTSFLSGRLIVPV
jgi:hypothetical protein